jgi:hypothetical protein
MRKMVIVDDTPDNIGLLYSMNCIVVEGQTRLFVRSQIVKVYLEPKPLNLKRTSTIVRSHPQSTFGEAIRSLHAVGIESRAPNLPRTLIAIFAYNNTLRYSFAHKSLIISLRRFGSKVMEVR